MLFDTHLMISEPMRYAKAFADAGSDHLTFHLECPEPTGDVIAAIREAGCTVGISLKPATPAEEIFPWARPDRPRAGHDRRTRFRRPEFHGGPDGEVLPRSSAKFCVAGSMSSSRRTAASMRRR